MCWRRFLCLCLLLCYFPLAEEAWAQAVADFKFAHHRNRVKIPFKLIHNLVVIPLQINGSPALNFVVDTGVDRTLLLELGENDSLLINDVERLRLRGLGQGEEIGALASRGNRIQLAGVEARNQDILVLEENVFNLSSKLGLKINGILGYPLFKNFVVEIDYENKIMTLYKPGSYPEKKSKAYTVIPLIIESAKPYVEAQAICADGRKQPVRLIVDSGMSASMMLYPNTLESGLVPQTTIDAYLGRGLNGSIYGEIGRIKALQIGDFVLQHPPASFPDSLSIKYALLINNRNGNLGADVLQRFKVVFDYANSHMLLLPNRKFKQPFYFNLSGLELLSPIPGINYYTVAEVMPYSPAHYAGLKIGDSIISINGIKCMDKSMGEILDFFQSKPGRKIRLRVDREQKRFDAVLHLQDVI